jgi:hypothetical protein
LGVLKTPTLRYLQQNHRSEPKFKKNWIFLRLRKFDWFTNYVF